MSNWQDYMDHEDRLAYKEAANHIKGARGARRRIYQKCRQRMIRALRAKLDGGNE